MEDKTIIKDKESNNSVKSSFKENLTKCGIQVSSEVRPSHLGLK
jgi:hypothetical protein